MNREPELRHLRRDIKTAVELAVVALAPQDLIERLACTAGLLEALSELPEDSPPAVAWVPRTFQRAAKDLARWRSWEKTKLKKGIA